MAEYKLWQLTADMAGGYTADSDGYAPLPREPDELLCIPWLRHGPIANDPYAWTVKDFDGAGHVTALPPPETPANGRTVLSVTYIEPNWRAVSASYPYGWQTNLAVWECDLAVRIGETWQTGRYCFVGQYNSWGQYFPHLIVAGTAAEPQFSLGLGTATYALDASKLLSGWVHIRVAMTGYEGSSNPVTVYADGALALTGTCGLPGTEGSFLAAMAMSATGKTWGDNVTKIICANPSLSEIEDLPVRVPQVSMAWSELSTAQVTATGSAVLDDNAQSATYLWDDTAGTQDASLTLAAPETGLFVLQVTDDAGQYCWYPLEVLNQGVYASLVWSTGDTTVAITVTESGTYTVTVTNAAGSAEASYTVTFPGPVEIFKVFRSGDHDASLRAGPVTVQSQYAASPRILALAAQYWQLLDPTPSADLMISKMIDPSTAAGYGLDVWGRIVGVKRALVPVGGDYLAFAPPSGVTNPEGNSWDNAPFNPVNSAGYASDAIYRVYVYVKAMLNIGNGSLADLNRYFSLLFPGSGIKIIHSGTMIIRVLDFSARLTAADILALRTLDWLPLGVGWQLWQGTPDCFGFAGSELQPFDQAPFLSESALTIYD